MPKRIILAVDDEPMMTRLVEVNLERAGYDVRKAPDGATALQVLQSKEVCPDLILLDVTMPYMDGFELLKRIKEDPDLEAIPVIMMTARSRDEDMLYGQTQGAVRYLPKPVHPDDLLSHVQEVLGEEEES